MEATRYEMDIGDAAPPFTLPGVDGRDHSLGDYGDKDVVIIAFTCNHCPYVQAYEDRLMAIQADYGSRGVQLIAINSNETENYPQDSFDHMVARAKERGFNYPYLRDDTQEVADAYGAVCTPHIMVFDQERKLRYQGRVDDNMDEPDAVEETYLRDALDALLEGRDPPRATTWAIGCSIKWSQ